MHPSISSYLGRNKICAMFSTVDNLISFDHGRLLEGSLKSWQAAAEILAVKEVEVEGGQKVAVSFKMGTYPRCCRLSGVL